MRRHRINYIVDGVFFLLFIVLGLTGILLEYVLPPGSGQGRSRVWGLTRHDWGDVHFWVAVAAGAALLIHLALHWAWVWSSSAQFLGGQGWLGRLGRSGRFAGGLAILGVMVAGTALFWRAAAGQVEHVDAGVGGYRGGRGAGRMPPSNGQTVIPSARFPGDLPTESAEVQASDSSTPRRWHGGRATGDGEPRGDSNGRRRGRNADNVNR